MRLIDANKLHVDKQINGECWISQEQIINASTVEAVPLSVIEDIKAEITAQKDDCATTSYYTRLGFETALAIIDKAVKECTHEV